MVDWMTYQGEGPWTFEKSPSKPRYNVGSSIATSEDPTWDTYDFTGEPVSDGHDPCGYWPTEPYEYEPPYHFEGEDIGLRGTSVAWGPVARSPINGCFVKILGTVGSYSDDGGFTWTNSLDTSAGGSTHYVTYQNGLFIVYRYTTLYYSSDGISWTTVDLTIFYASVLLVYSVTYNPIAQLFVLPIKRSGTQVRRTLYGNTTLSSFVCKSQVLLAYGSYYANCVFKNIHYLWATNYNYYWYSAQLSQVSDDWTQDSVSSKADRYNMVASNTIMLCGNGYTIDGSTWITSNMIDYNSNSDILYAHNAINGFVSRVTEYDGGSRTDIMHSRDGLSWEVSVSGMSFPVYDLALGDNGYVVVGADGLYAAKKVEEIEVSLRAYWISGKQKWLNIQGQTPWTL